MPTHRLVAFGRRLGMVAGLVLATTASQAHAGGPWLPHNVSTFGDTVDHLYNVIFVLTTVLFVLTEGLLVFFIFRYRRRAGRKASHIHESSTAETVWTVIPGVILLVLAIYQWNAWADAKIRVPDEDKAVRIQIMAKQFEWNIRYAGPDGMFATDDDVTVTNQIYIPENREVVIQMRAEDVIHSFFLPNFRVKQDVMPGMTTMVWFDSRETGDFEIACAELCGLGHYRMKGLLHVYTADDFESWLQKKYDAGAAPADWGWNWKEGV